MECIDSTDNIRLYCQCCEWAKKSTRVRECQHFICHQCYYGTMKGVCKWCSEEEKRINEQTKEAEVKDDEKDEKRIDEQVKEVDEKRIDEQVK